MSVRRPLLALLAAVFATTLAGSPIARADWGPAQVMSATSTQQAEVATAPALSQDGRFVVFEGTYAGKAGVWRKRVGDGGIELVAEGAGAPSISADGRWVAFTTAVALAPDLDRNTADDVYVRDMDLAADATGAYTLASALDGADSGLLYGPGAGSRTAPRGAISADGRSVVFTVTSTSNLADGGAAPTTPAGQVAVRRLDTRETILVSTAIDPATREQTTAPAPNGTVRANMAPTASISADGTTVAWFGAYVAEQTRTVANEAAAQPINRDGYAEPLWRRVADGPTAPTRRVTGGGDPFNAACPADGAVTPDDGSAVVHGQNPCDGPFAILRVGSATGVPGTLVQAGDLPSVPQAAPQLSADGWTTAILASVPLRDTTVLPMDQIAASNAYVVDMRPGLSRWQALRPLTKWAAVSSANSLLGASIDTISISPDGTHVAFTTARGAFPLSPPLLLDPPLARASGANLYDVDLRTGTMRRATRTFGGDPVGTGSPGGLAYGSYQPTYSGDDRRIAFGSGADDLFYGDGNEAADVFVIDWSDPLQGPGPPLEQLSPPPANVVLRPSWKLGVTASSRRDGRVSLQVVVPGAGKLSARAVTVVRARTSSTGARARRRARARRVVAAQARAVAGTPGLIVLPLRASRRFVAATRRGRGLAATVTVAFALRSGRTLRTTVAVRFRQQASRRARSRRSSSTRSNSRGAR
ncbi:hypothetical protein Q5424_17185 [Conexibacter sp. JD483]|uniref:hypothetical protein n=1 Tax=unclassified Conexibacter TaxID=2627773 RepID=UPI00271C9FF8|nr:MULTISPECIES: hypothetical protein [unclassified Conexibacter]MDO8188661.1 hypothetical protein [Conexibacter sp. CPCC 205706]MDO8199366.1 hypothetical protein [Conexibacter sp. CPCC 205762]MDR9370834.1 hypothetical protein [Conexibacter sp. JD483]